MTSIALQQMMKGGRRTLASSVSSVSPGRSSCQPDAGAEETVPLNRTVPLKLIHGALWENSA